jgi:hypothetical protein
MKSTGHNGEKNGYKVILLVVVGLTAFSSAMKELNQLQQFSLEASRLVAQWSERFAPAEVPAVPHTTEVKQMVVQVESCDLKQSAPSVELPWLSNVAPVTRPAPRAVVPRPSQAIDVAKNLPKPTDFQFARLKKLPQIDFDSAHFDFTITTDDGLDPAAAAELKAAHDKARTRRVRELRIQTRDREIFLKNLNRSINLRVAS